LRLCWQLRSVGAVVAVLGGLATGGCAYQLQSLTAKDDPDLDQTGSMSQPAGGAAHTASAASGSEVDLAYARAAVSDALAHTGKDTSVPWQNPNTGAGGNITPLASSYSEGGRPCRDFLASYVHGAAQDWLQGAACRTAEGHWEVTSLKPLKRS
jgi:surface antigen